MKKNPSLLVAVLAVFGLTLSLAAQDTALNDVVVRNAAYDFPADHGRLEKLSSFTGKEIIGNQDEKVGKVKDFAIDLENGRIVEVIVSTGGMMGMNSKHIAVPPSLFTCDPDVKTLRLRLNAQQLKDAPAFDLSAWPQTFEKTNILENYARYKLQPYFVFDTNTTLALSPREVENRGREARGMERIGYIEKGSTIVGLSVTNGLGEKIGKVENLVVDLNAGRVVAVVISSGGFLGIGDELSAVPPYSFRYNSSHDALQLDVSKEAMVRAPHFNASRWPDVNQSNYLANLYGVYQARPYPEAVDADNTAQNQRDRNGNTLTPLDQGTSAEDVDTTRQIRVLIMARKGLSVDARNIKVITVNGRVTLRGPVKSESEKSILVDIARSVVAGGPAVNNQIDVKALPDSANSSK